MWLNMTFIGDVEYDLDFSNIFAAISGNFSIADLFISTEGLTLIALFGTGVLFGISVPWLGRGIYNLILSLVYTISRKVKDKDKSLNDSLKKIKNKIQTKRLLIYN